jgi:hypothetical protein
MTGHGRKMGNKGTVRKRGRKMTEKVWPKGNEDKILLNWREKVIVSKKKKTRRRR